MIGAKDFAHRAAYFQGGSIPILAVGIVNHGTHDAWVFFVKIRPTPTPLLHIAVEVGLAVHELQGEAVRPG